MSSYNIREGMPRDERYAAFLTGIKKWAIYSQHAEESILEAIFQRIGNENQFCVEAGAADGLFMSNTRYLVDQGWSAIYVEPDTDDFQRLQEQFADNPKVQLHQGFLASQPRTEHEITLDGLLAKYNAPQSPDVLVLDVDSSEYYLLLSMLQFTPRVIIVEFDPDVEPMFIPELNGPGQAGHLALRYVAEARGYSVICRTATNLICVRKDLAPMLEASPEQWDSGQKEARAEVRTLAALINNANSYGPREIDEAGWRTTAAKVKQRQVDNRKKQSVQIAGVMSVPRLGYLDTLHQIQGVMTQASAPLLLAFGVYWHQSLTRAIEKALAFRTKDGKFAEYILTIDYDSYVTLDNLGKLAVILADNPAVDIIVPAQMKRAGGQLLCGTEGPVDLTQPLVPIVTGHFGFTLFKRDVFERLNKPWFWEKPDADGGWGEGRIDADIGFWRNVIASGCKPYLATQIIVGHGEEVVSWPHFENGQILTAYQTVKDWQEERQAAV